MKKCSKQGCEYPVWGKGYCKRHQYLRGDLVKKVKPISDKRKERNKEYEKAKKSILSNKCFFCGLILSESDHNKPHHLVPRSYSLELFDDPRNLVPVHFSCHREFHDTANSDMWAMPWYTEWLMSIRKVSEDYYQLKKYNTQHSSGMETTEADY